MNAGCKEGTKELVLLKQLQGAGIAQSVQRLAADWTVRGSNPHGDETLRTHTEWPSDLPNLQ